ncbi:protein croquemort-like [Aricia agestis]|uniref:protein croquemort-like n=1 Tax=Aricia agestis TaxID=91739 RepID=UPI001C20387F|nr:protein croquemort-like [Aricia agestis]XP_041984407.1 protein croquemort-like [Aricia agestis]
MVSAGKKSTCLMTCGSLLIVTGAIMVVFWPAIFYSQLKKMMILTDSSTSFSIWKDIPIPLYLECYLYHITNVEEIVSGKDHKIKLEQRGPYVFREFHTKENITWNENSTVTFYNKKVWHFQADMSNGTLADNVTNINPIIATVAYFMRYQHPLLKLTVDVFMKTIHEHMFITATASEWLFDGIDDPILRIADRFPELPFTIPFDKFGWFYDRNESLVYDGAFVMNTGASDFSQLGNVQMWRHSDRTQFRGECGEVRGSTGELWAPEFGQEEVEIFAPDLCTYMTLFKNVSTTVLGIEGVTYAANDSLFDNGYKYPRKACYCDEVRDRDCLPSGALNVSQCRYGAPAMVTQPHFLNMDPYYAQKVEGMDPKPDMNMALTLEMFTGMPLGVSAQLQINMLIRYVEAISLNNQLPEDDVLVPMMWFRQELSTTEEYANLARVALNVRYGVPYGLYALTAIGALLLLFGIYILVKKIMKSPETPILRESPSVEE